MDTIYAADLFCGAGGTSSGLKQAAGELGLDVQLVAVNHWNLAVATHTANHPDAAHFCADVQELDPRQVVPSGRLDLLVASPECTHFSTARGGKPTSDQQRISPWFLLEWLEKLDVRNVLIENVPDLRSWGPVGEGGKPIKAKKGSIYRRYLQTLRSYGYHVSDRVINCADYGDATTRERLFILCRKGHRVTWPEPTHAPAGKQQTLFGRLEPWRTARQCIDWGNAGESIYNRKRPLAYNTLRRIFTGLRKFSGLPIPIPEKGAPLQPYLVKFYGSNDAADIDQPLPTITAGGNHLGVVTPYLVKYYTGSDAVSVDEPMPTITANYEHIALAQPFLISYYTERDGQAPRVHSIDDPLPTVTTAPRFGLVEPFIISLDHTSSVQQPFMLETLHGPDARRVYSVDNPMKTITSVDAWALVQPYLVQYNGTGSARSIDDPLGAQTTRDRFGLVQPIFIQVGDQLYFLDIRFRMLTPTELAAAMSFPVNYKFTGSRENIVRQIGNAVPRRTAAALCKSLLR